MKYNGKLYGKVGGIYFDTGLTSNDWDELESKANDNSKFTNEDIERINKKLQTCRRIISKVERGEKEERLIKKRTEANREKAEKEIAKKKDRKRER